MTIIYKEVKCTGLMRTIQAWQDSAETDDLEKMAAPLMLRSLGLNDRARRHTKQHARRCRTLSPSKKSIPANVPYAKHAPRPRLCRCLH